MFDNNIEDYVSQCFRWKHKSNTFEIIEQKIKKARVTMSLSPNDIRNYEFPSQMRGYDKDEVDSFLDQVATTLENLKQENLKLSMESDSLKSQLDSLKQFEDSIKGAAIDARKNADSTMSSAKAEAEKILSEAKAKADELVSSKEEMISEYKKQLNRLEQTKNSFAVEIKDLINVHLGMINKITDSDFSYTPEEDEYEPVQEKVESSDETGSIEVTNSEEVERNQMNSVGTETSQEPIVREDANAVDKIVAVTEEAPIDPELADALAGFEQPSPSHDKVNPNTMIGGHSMPKPGQVVETNKRAEDIPEGFIVGNTVETVQHTPEEEEDTGKFNIGSDDSNDSCEHNAISVHDEITPDNIVQELDNVVAKFEEELDKAESK